MTGGTAGIGRATALALIDEGADVFISGRNAPPTNSKLDKARFIPADIASPQDVSALIGQIATTARPLSLTVNCAGYEGVFHPIDLYPDEDCRRVFAVNALGTFWAMKYQIETMRQYGGSIVNVSSIAGLKGVPTASAFAASKHAVIGMTRSAALEVVESGIRINALCPALVDTQMAERLSQKSGISPAKLAQASPMKRPAAPDEVVAAILWLLSDQASFVTGQAISVDAGQSIT